MKKKKIHATQIMRMSRKLSSLLLQECVQKMKEKKIMAVVTTFTNCAYYESAYKNREKMLHPQSGREVVGLEHLFILELFKCHRKNSQMFMVMPGKKTDGNKNRLNKLNGTFLDNFIH